jgi:ABC-type phosphate transport system substrate-binding protein
MLKLKSMMLTGACALAAGVTGMSSPASAGVTGAWGGGSSLISVYMVQAFNCYGKPQQLIIRSPLSLQDVNPFNYTGAKGKPQNCATDHVSKKAALHYDSAGSGIGIAGVFSHDPASTAPNGYGDIDPNTSGEQDMPYITYGMSDAGLSSTDVGVYNNGNADNGDNAACSAPLQKVCVVAPGHTAHPPVTYPNPNEHRGALIQFPISVDPVAFGYDPVYKKVNNGGTITSYKFNIHFAHTDGTGGLRLDRNAYCTIFNGIAEGGNAITNWNDSRLKALNGGDSLADPSDPNKDSFSVPLQIVGRSDSSGTTSIFTRHLAHVCGTLGINDPNNQYADGATTLPVSLQGGTFDGTNVTGEVLGKFTLANGNNNVAKYVAFLDSPAVGQTLIQGRLGYMGSDFTAPYNQVNGQNNYNLNSADLKNVEGKWVQANGANALTAFGSLTPPQSDAKGHYDLSSCPNANARCRAHPWDWAEPVSKTSPLADPAGKTSYPVMGTTNVLLYTCYASPKVAGVVKKFFTWYTKNAVVQEVPDGLLTKNGLASLPTAWRTAITETFLNNKSGLNLTIDAAGNGVCAGKEGG